jgi:hypothetical protein
LYKRYTLDPNLRSILEKLKRNLTSNFLALRSLHRGVAELASEVALASPCHVHRDGRDLLPALPCGDSLWVEAYLRAVKNQVFGINRFPDDVIQ